MTTNHHISQLKKEGRKTNTFFFKKFKVEDGRSTMKVGTDAVLLGVVADVSGVGKILEIGTGCGIIALILAQRSEAQIDAIEIDEESVVQTKENVENSPWKNRINIIHNSLQDYSDKTKERYDLVISNPPYFSRSLKSSILKRNISRHDESLSFAELIEGASGLMSPDASFWVILPVNTEKDFLEKARKSGFFLHNKMKISHKQAGDYQRIILLLKKKMPESVIENNLSIKNEDDSFTTEYIELTKDFYIDF